MYPKGLVHDHDMSTTISKPGPIDYAAMFFTALIWASAFVAIKVAVPEAGPLWLATWRVIIGFLVLLPYALWRGFLWPAGPGVWALVAITSIFNVVLPFFLISWAETRIDAGVAALLMGTGPFLALIGSHFFTSDDRINGPKLFAVLLGFCGVVLIVGYEAATNLGGASTLHQLAALGGALCYAISGLLIRRIKIPPIRLGCLVLGSGAFILLLAAPMVEGPPRLDLSRSAVVALIYLGIVPTGIGQLLRFSLVKKVGYSTFALALNMIPVFGIALGAMLLGEVVTLHTIIALLLVLSGLFVSRMAPESIRSVLRGRAKKT